MPGYPGDTSPYAALADIRTASAGDPVIAWDNHGSDFPFTQKNQAAIMYVKSTDGGRTFSTPQVLTNFVLYRSFDQPAAEPIPIPESSADDPKFEEEGSAPTGFVRDCGDFSNHCASGYTFFRRDPSPRSTADQFDKQHEWVYVIYDATKPGTQVQTGTTFSSVAPGIGSQSGVYFTRLDGATGAHTPPVLIDNQNVGYQFFPDVSADGGVLHAIWWDSRTDPCYSPTRPIGNCADRRTVPSLDVWASVSNDFGNNWTGITRVTNVSSNPNYEQFDNRTIRFAGDYLWVTSLANFSFGVWTDWRNTIQGVDPREVPEDEDNATADVKQCRTFNTATGTWSGDQCPHDGGIDQDIFGDYTP